ncbi:MAG: uroporphyrinogen-III synthase [Flavobacteriales bacterium]
MLYWPLYMKRGCKTVTRVLASRPQAQNVTWLRRLNEYGFETINLPLLAITELEDCGEKRQSQNYIANLDQYNHCIFVSQNAVHYGFDAIDAQWPQVPIGIDWIAIGRKTQAQMERALDAMNASIYVSVGSEVMTSESLLALPQLQSIKNKKILICRGMGGRKVLSDELNARGAIVDECILYRRERPSTCTEDFSKIDFVNDDILCVFSGETLENLAALMAKSRSNQKADLKNNKLVVPGERVANIAKGLGFKQVVIAANASEDEMMATLKCYL